MKMPPEKQGPRHQSQKRRDQHGQAPVVADRAEVPLEQALAAQTQALIGTGWNKGDGYRSIDVGTDYYLVQAAFEGERFEIANPNTKLDMSHLQYETLVRIKSSVVNGRIFFPVNPDGYGQNALSLGVDDTVDVERFFLGGGDVFIVTLKWGVPDEATLVKPTSDRLFLNGGQSNAAIPFVNGFVGGFSRRFDEALSAAAFPTIEWINSAKGGSGISNLSGGADFWWDFDANGGAGGPAPLLVELETAAAAAVTEGHPAPDVLTWDQGESEAAMIAAGQMTSGQYKDATLAVFERLHAIYPGIRIIASGPQSRDDPSLFKGLAAIRAVYIELAETLDYVFQDIDWHDLPRQWGNWHPYSQACPAMGYRSASRILQIDGINVFTAPEMTGWRLVNNGLCVELSITCDTDPISIPEGAAGFGEDVGPGPFDFYCFGGDVQTTEPIPLKSGKVTRVSATELTVTLHSETDLTGARIYALPGISGRSRLGRFIRTERPHGTSLGLPLISARTAPLS